jgi:flagellar secretion chaperone FliS
MDNSMRSASSNPYLANLVLSASPVQLVALLYDGLIRFLNAALEGFSEEDPQKRIEIVHNNLIRAQNILAELNASLDRQQGGEFAHQMGDLYEFYNATLRQINSTKNPTSLPKVIRLITELRDAWHQAAVLGASTDQNQIPVSVSAAS